MKSSFIGSQAPRQSAAPRRRRWSPLNAPLRDWEGRRVWIVGASAGIGAALASALHAGGARVWASARPSPALEALRRDHPGCEALPLDVTDAATVHAAAAQVLAGGVPDLVVYCAGHYREMRATAMDLAEMRRHWDVNYVGALHVADAVVPALVQAGRGHLSLVASVAGYQGLPRGLAYGPTKAALIHLAETLYLDLSPLGIGVSVVNPGFVQTRLTAQNAFHMPALMDAPAAAQAMLDGWARGAFDIHFPRRFTLWLKLLRALPYRLGFAAVRRATGL